MLSGLLCRGVTTVLGFVWPAYQCYKDVENNKCSHRKWCMYWIVIVLYTSLERLGDVFLFWLPLYSELKIALVYFLACANGTEYVYVRFLMPFLSAHQALIDDKVAVGQAYIQNHISANLSWVSETVRARMFGMIAAVQQFQMQQAAAGVPPGGSPKTQSDPWQIPAVPTSSAARGPRDQSVDAAGVTTNMRAHRRFGFR